MSSQRTDRPIVAFSVKVYQALLVAYPTNFRQEYGSEMVQVFEDCCLRAARQSGTNGIFKLWAFTLLDLLQSVISEHRQKEVQITKEWDPEDIRRAGSALIWGAVAFVIGMLPLILGGPPLWGIYALVITFISMPLLVIGLLGVRNRYGEKVGRFGKNVLLFGAILSPLLSLIGLLGILSSISLFGNTNPPRLLGILFIIGPAVLPACLALFGIVALYKKPLPRWNVVPVIAGLWYPILTLFYILTSMSTGDWEGKRSAIPESLLIILIAIQGIALAALGYILKSDVPEETAAIA